MRKLDHGEILERRLSVEESLAAERHPVVAVLEDIRSLYNVGACFRTADAMLLRMLLLSGYTPTPPRKEISKTALGATESVPWRYHADPAEAIISLKQEGYSVYALEIAEGSIGLDRFEPTGPIAFVAGNEIAGVSARSLELCDGAIEIPMFGVKHSLNIAVAFGIAAYELTRKVRSSGL